MKFSDMTKLLLLEKNESGVGLRAGLVKAREGISCPRDEAPNNSK